MLLHKHADNSYQAYFEKLAEILNSAITDDTIHFPAETGTGFIKSILLEPDFCLRYYNFTCKQDISLDLFATYPADESNYELLFNIDPKDAPDASKNDFNSSRSTILLYSSGVEKKGVFSKNMSVRRLQIIFTTKWLLENYAEASVKMENLITDLATKNKSTIVSENMDTQSRFVATQLANELDKNSYPQIHIKTACFILLNDFLNKIVQRNRQEILSDQTLHYYTMLKVEERINQSINQKLPNLDQFAAEFNLSLSTLKRHFKIVYGKNIYQYYQEKRMEWGKAQLEKGNTTISEIATHLGFYKINNFSIAFKKYFGVLPRELKNKNYIHINN